MRDILHMMHFDFVSVRRNSLPGACLGVAGLIAFAYLWLPPASLALLFLGSLFLQQDGSSEAELRRMYGILPVSRRNIVRARFHYIFLLNLAVEILTSAVYLVSLRSTVYRHMPVQAPELKTIIEEMHTDGMNPGLLLVFVLFCMVMIVSSAYMETMGQIFGRENKMRILLITMGVFTAAALGFFALVNADILPAVTPALPDTTAGFLKAAVIAHLVAWAVCMILGELTARRMELREL